MAGVERIEPPEVHWQIEDITVGDSSAGKPSFNVVAATITTAAALSREISEEAAPALPRVSPDVFQQGMTVMHPEYDGQDRGSLGHR